jgi:hypothetical protein
LLPPLSANIPRYIKSNQIALLIGYAYTESHNIQVKGPLEGFPEATLIQKESLTVTVVDSTNERCKSRFLYVDLGSWYGKSYNFS